MTDPRLDSDDTVSPPPDSSSSRINGSQMQSSHLPRLSSPILTNANRPPSSASVHSSTSSGAPRTTATSRRGGRTRSRSPPVVLNRPPLNTERDYSALGDGAGPINDDYRNNDPPSPANPSSAAAKAAAAAKAFSSGGGAPEPSSWYPAAPDGADHDPRYHSDYDSSYPDSRSWPGEELYSGRRHQYAYRRGQGDPYNRRGPVDSYAAQPYYEGGADYSDRRYREQRSHSPYNGESHRRLRATDRRSPNHSQGHYSDPNLSHEYYGGPAGMAPAALAPDGRSSPKEISTSLKRGGGTRQVIGTPTPIHVPRAPDPPNHRHSRGGTPASVFRGRPGDMAPRGDDVDDDSPQKILLSLRTPTASFEENPQAAKSLKSTGETTLPLSPEEPPQIHHSHHSSSDQNLLFEPQRSPGGGGALEIAPSFTLFNQSFDSLGDSAQYFNVGPLDSALQSTSFGAGPSASIDNEGGGQMLNRNMSGGSYPQQLLAGSGSGGLTFGMSPVNSFGNGAPPSSQRRGGNMMVLGGHDARSASPTQVLGMYRSYSGGVPYLSSRPTEDGHMRSTGESFGGASINHSYTRSFGVESSPIQYRGQSAGPLVSEGVSAFYSLLRKHRGAFKECMFLLPGLKAALLESPLSSKDRSGPTSHETSKSESKTILEHGRRGRSYNDPSPQDTAIAMRRVASAVCAFGGSVNRDRADQYDQSTKTSAGQSIFREKSDVETGAPSATVTPSSSTGTPPGKRFESRAKLRYDEQLPSRYYENENRLSWEFEESPPVENAVDDDGGGSERGDDSNKANYSGKGGQSSKNKKLKTEGEDLEKVGSSSEGGKNVTSPSPLGDQPKMRYRCKLCGQPKQNHTCPYQQSLQRSIGIMIYPAVNAYTAVEPGHLAPALSDMNNFITPGGDSIASGETSPSRASPDRMRRITQPPQVTSGNQVTPETLRSAAQANSPSSTLSTGSGTPQRFRTPGSTNRKARGHFSSKGVTPTSTGNRKKRPYVQFSGGNEDQTDLLFMESIELKPEQFRIVTPSNATCLPDAFVYPSLPLPYAQRKRLSDNLFALSKEVPQLTDECAVVLREAREKDLWDLAVAELMTQVVVIIHCPEGDPRFEGLRQYLLTLGIAC